MFSKNLSGLYDVNADDISSNIIHTNYLYVGSSLINPSSTVGQQCTIAPGTATTLPSGSNPTVTNSGNSINAIFNFGIPAGPTGPTGSTGLTGPTGATGPAGPQGLSITYVGTWSASTPSYTVGQVVYYSTLGQSYVCIANNTNTPPTNTAYWGLISLKGDQGIQGIQGLQGLSIIYVGTWNNATTYTVGQVVYYSVLGQSYVCVANNTNVGPENTAYWGLISLKGDQGIQGPKGDKGATGDKGDKGNTGDKGDSGGVLSLAEIIAGIASSFVSAGAFASLQSQLGALQTQVAAIETQQAIDETNLTTLNNKTAYLSTVTTSSRFTSPLLINNGVSDRITLNQDGSSSFLGNMNVNGSSSASEFIAQSALSFTNTVGIVGYATPTLNIGNSLSNSIINIGGGTTLINLNGIVNMPYNGGTFNMSSWINQL